MSETWVKITHDDGDDYYNHRYVRSITQCQLQFEVVLNDGDVIHARIDNIELCVELMESDESDTKRFKW